jgi:predicted Fe-S protein YdhL (DUF1289 family)
LDKDKKIVAKSRGVLTRAALRPIARRDASAAIPANPSKVEPMVDSPCIKICELNGDGVCVGCGRTRAEIAGWMSMSDAQKAKVVELADMRKRAMSASDKGDCLIASSE